MKLALVVTAAIVTTTASPALAQQSTAVQLWNQQKVAFGVFVPNDEAARTAAYNNPLYDFLFLNLEPRYDPAAIKDAVAGVRGPKDAPRKTIIVRIPTVERDGLDAAKARIKEAFDLGADGVTVPHVRSVDEAKQVLQFFRDTGADIWSASNSKGNKLAMLMIEDPGALAQAREFADLKGYSILACGIGSLTQALGGNREAAEAGTQKVLAESRRTNLVNMLTTTARDVEQRVNEGFLALIAQGPTADAAINAGRAVAPR